MTNISVFQLITDASYVVQFVVFILFGTSIICWTFVFIKHKEIKLATTQVNNFENIFWSGIELTKLYKKLLRNESTITGTEKFFLVGYKEFFRTQLEDDISLNTRIENVQKTMRIELARELNILDDSLSFLATVGSTSPYVGLLGTVYGVMNSFNALGGVKQVTLAHIAPGISEALIATAIALFVAIPAVVAYNYFSAKLDRLVGRYEIFIDEFTGLLQRGGN